MEDGKIQWHPAFYAALQIELLEYKPYLNWEREYLLGKKPLQVDIIIVKKETNVQIKKGIGQIFQKHNIIEYKSPEDSLSVNDFYKVYGYACLYQAESGNVRSVDPMEITITLVCNSYPRKLIRHLTEEREMTLQKCEDGIYHLLALPQMFPVQVIIVKELSEDNYYWLQKLRNNLKSGGEIQKLIENYEGKKDNPLYQAVMNVLVRANQEEMEVEKKMCEALKELFADELKNAAEEGRAAGLAKGLAEGRAEGRAEGLQAMRDNIVMFLQDTGSVTEDVMKKLDETTDMELLKQWVRISSKCKSSREFMEAIGSLNYK